MRQHIYYFAFLIGSVIVLNISLFATYPPSVDWPFLMLLSVNLIVATTITTIKIMWQARRQSSEDTPAQNGTPV